MARHIELGPPSVNNLDQFMNKALRNAYEKERKQKFVKLVFKKLTEKIEDGVRGPKDDQSHSPSNRSSSEENSSEDDNIDISINYLDSSENISD